MLMALRCLRVLTLAVLLSVGRAPLLAEDLVLVGEGSRPCPIYAQKQDRLAARSLSRYLGQVSGVEFPFKIVQEAPAGRSVLVGAFDSDVARDLPGDSFTVRTEGEADGLRLRVAGATPRATHFAVFAFLEEVLGCRWWSFNEEEVPLSPTIRVKPLDMVRKAVFRQTDLLNREAQSRTNGFVYKSRAKSTETFTGGHTLYPLLKPYGKDHPEIYPYSKKTKKRAANNLHFCYRAQGIAEALANALDQQVQRRKGNVRDFIYFAGMGDWYGGMCQCEPCAQVYAEEVWTRPDGKKQSAYSSTLIRMMNRTAEILEKRYAGIRVGTFAYMSLEGPPGKTRPRHNVVIWLPHLRHCVIHAADQCEKNRNYLANLKRWCEIAPGRVYVWDYGINFGENFLYPFPVLTSIAENIRLYARLGVAGIMVQGNYVSTGSDLAVLKNYVWQKLLWNPELKTEALTNEFCQGYYGPASSSMLAYVSELEGALRQNPAVHMNEFARRVHMRNQYLTDDRMAKLRQLLDRAREQARGQDPFARRVEEAAVSIDAFELWKVGPLVEREGRLVRADLGNVDTFPRALKLLEHCRQASPREWGGGRAYRLGFQTLHGGPLVTLMEGKTQVKVAPVLGMRIRQISYNGVELLRMPDSKERGYPLRGGSYERFSQGHRNGELLGESSGTRVEMQADCGIKHWGGDTKQRAHKVVELLPSDTIRITGASLQIHRSSNYGKARCSSVMEYAVGGGPEAVEVQVLTKEGQWQTAVFRLPEAEDEPAPKKKRSAPKLPQAAVPPGAKALRLHMKAKGCTVEDRYLSPLVSGGILALDARAGVLTTSVATEDVELSRKTETSWLKREIQLRSSEKQ